jgi:hypothetical protein
MLWGRFWNDGAEIPPFQTCEEWVLAFQLDLEHLSWKSLHPGSGGGINAVDITCRAGRMSMKGRRWGGNPVRLFPRINAFSHPLHADSQSAFQLHQVGALVPVEEG